MKQFSAGAPKLPAIRSPINAESTAIMPSGSKPAMGGAVKTMSPMETMMEVWFEMRDGINNLVDLMKESLDLENREERRDLLAQRNSQIAAGDTDTQTPQAQPTSGGNMLDSLKEALSGMGSGGKGLLGLGALIVAVLAWNALADELVELLTPILEFLGETLIPNLKELNEVIQDHPGGYWALLGATGLVYSITQSFGEGGTFAKMFTNISQWFKDVLNPKTLMFRENSKTWKYKITQSISGRNGIIRKITTFFDDVSKGIRGAFSASAFKISAWTAVWKTALLNSFIGKAARGGRTGALLTKVSSFVSRIASSVRGLFTGGATGKIFGNITRIVSNFARSMKRITRTVGRVFSGISRISGLTQFLRLGLGLIKAVPILGQIVMVIQGIFGFVKGAIEGWKTGGVFGAITGGLIGMWDAVIGSLGNLIADIIGWILKKLGFEALGEFFSNLDFTISGMWNGIKGALLTVFDGLRWAINKAINGMIFMVNAAITALNWIPGVDFEPIDYQEFKPTERENVQPAEVPKSDFVPSDNSDQISKIQAQKTPINTDIASAMKVDYSGMDNDFASQPVFQNIEMGTSGDTTVANNTYTSHVSTAQHTDATASLLSKRGY